VNDLTNRELIRRKFKFESHHAVVNEDEDNLSGDEEMSINEDELI
jgi:hypothetical protein